MKKKLIPIVLLLVLLIGILVPTVASAAETESEQVYVSLGDSIGAGFDTSTHKSVVGFEEVEDSYPYLVTKTLGLMPSYQCCVGLRSNEVCYLLGLNHYVQDDYFALLQQAIPQLSAENIAAKTAEIQNGVEQASLITVQCGANDMILGPLYNALRQAVGEAGTETAEEESPGGDIVFDAILDLMNQLNESGNYTEFLEAFSQEGYAGYEQYCANLPAMIEQLKEWNGGARIVIIGNYNPYANLDLGLEDLDINMHFGILLSCFADLVNEKTKEIAEAYGCSYVDVTGTETYYDAHPTTDGHAYIAQQILEGLTEVSTTISNQKNSGIRNILRNGFYTSTISVSASLNGDSSAISKVEYSLNGLTYQTISNAGSVKKPLFVKFIFVRVTDTNGDVTVWYCTNGTSYRIL